MKAQTKMLAIISVALASTPATLAQEVTIKEWSHSGSHGSGSATLTARYGTSGVTYTLNGTADRQGNRGGTFSGSVTASMASDGKGSASGEFSGTTASGKAAGAEFTASGAQGQGISGTINTVNHGSFDFEGSKSTGFSVTKL